MLHRLASASTDPQLDGLRFVESSGAWRVDGAQFACVAYGGGDNEIVVEDVGHRRTVRRYATPDIGSVQNLAWSPDGGRLAFSGTVGGIGDLFVLDLEWGDIPYLPTGLSARVNVLGALILEACFAYPFQRPDKGWHWGFNLAPGW